MQTTAILKKKQPRAELSFYKSAGCTQQHPFCFFFYQSIVTRDFLPTNNYFFDTSNSEKEKRKIPLHIVLYELTIRMRFINYQSLNLIQIRKSHTDFALDLRIDNLLFYEIYYKIYYVNLYVY